MKYFIHKLLFLAIIVFDVNAETPPEPSSLKTTNQEVTANEYMVVTAHELASKAAKDMIEKGGNAIDAAIAAQMVLTIVEPQSSGIGGGGFLLFYDIGSKKLTSYDGRETAPELATPNMFLDDAGEPTSFMEAVRGVNAVGVPGLVHMLKKAHKKHGKLEWSDLFEPAIKIAKEGFEVSNRLHKSIEYSINSDVSDEFRKLYLDNWGEPKKIGAILQNQEIVKVLEEIAKGGTNYFYNGEIAAKISRLVESKGGNLRKSDFEKYQSKIRENLCSKYRGYKICSMGLPSSGGLTLLQTLGILENFELNNPYDTQEISIILQAQKLAFADRNHYLADSDFVEVPSARKFLDKSYLKQRVNLIKLGEVDDIKSEAGELLSNKNGDDKSFDAPSTTHLSIIDKQGNAVSLTSSVEHSFGSGIVVDGFVLNNQLTDFSFLPEVDGKLVANRVQPNKRPRSSMTPTIIFAPDGELYAVIGSPGGSSIIPYVTKAVISLIDWKMSPKETIDLPHFMHKNTKVQLERGVDKEIYNDLKTLGFNDVSQKRQISGLNIIVITGEGNLVGYADGRREGVALGQ